MTYEIIKVPKKAPIRERYDCTVFKQTSKAREMPPIATRMFGCMNCDWRGTALCDYGIPRGSGYYFKEIGIDFDTICEVRKWFILSLYDGDNARPTYKDLYRVYNDSLIQENIHDIKGKMRILDEKIIEKEKELKTQEIHGEPEEIEIIKKDIRDMHMEQGYLQNNLMTNIHSVRKLDIREREVDSKIKTDEMVRDKMTISDLHTILRKDFSKAVDAEYEENK